MLSSIVNAIALASAFSADAIGDDVEIHGLVAAPSRTLVKGIVGSSSSSPRIREAAALVQSDVVISLQRSLFSDANLDALSRCLFSAPAHRLLRARPVLVVVDDGWVDVAIKS